MSSPGTPRPRHEVHRGHFGPHREEPTFQGVYGTLHAYYSAQIATLRDGRYIDQTNDLTYRLISVPVMRSKQSRNCTRRMAGT